MLMRTLYRNIDKVLFDSKGDRTEIEEFLSFFYWQHFLFKIFDDIIGELRQNEKENRRRPRIIRN